jgi:hypothetical protein
MSRKPKMFFLFDNSGTLLLSNKSLNELCVITGGNYGAIFSAFQRKSCFNMKYYISDTKDFDASKVFKKSNFNPLLSKLSNKHRLDSFGFDTKYEFFDDYD